MARLRATTLAFILAASLLALSAHATKTWYGKKYEHPRNRTWFVRSYVTTTNSSSNSSIVALGLQFHDGMLSNADALPPTSTDAIPLGPPFGTLVYNFTEFDLDIPQVGLGNPFKYFRAGYGPKGHIGFRPQPDTTVWGVAHWDMHASLVTKAQYDAVWAPGTRGFCPGGMNKDLFVRSNTRMVASCAPRGYNSTGNHVWGHGNHLVEANTTWFRDGTPFERDLIFGQFDGQVYFVEPMITNAVMLAATRNGRCWTFARNLPKAFPQEYSMPRKYCVRKLGGTSGTVMEMQDFRTVAKGNCNPNRAGAKLAENTFWPAGVPLPPGCELTSA